MHARHMTESHPAEPRDKSGLVAAIDACFDCEQTCSSCADACLHEEMVADLRRCIHTNLDCADVCGALGRALSRSSKPDARLMSTLIQACVAACLACADECRKHAKMHEHCRVCAEVCEACERACQALLKVTPTV